MTTQTAAHEIAHRARRRAEDEPHRPMHVIVTDTLRVASGERTELGRAIARARRYSIGWEKFLQLCLAKCGAEDGQDDR